MSYNIISKEIKRTERIMQKHSTITISTLSGTISMTVHRAISYLLLIISGTIVATLVGGLYFIKFLNDSNHQIRQDYVEAENTVSVVMGVNTELTEDITEMAVKLADKDKIIKSSKIYGTLLKKKKTNDIFGSVELVSFRDINSPDDRSLHYALDRVSQSLDILHALPSGTPLEKDSYISSAYGVRRHPVYNKAQFHHGIDMPLVPGDKVINTADGTVSFSGRKIGYGITVIIDHNFGFSTHYAHLDKSLVQKGDIVKKGQAIAHGGNSGVSTGPHIHYEIRYLGKALNPYYFYDWNLSNFESIFSRYETIKWDQIITALGNDTQN